MRDVRVQPDPAQDVLPLALVERHHGTGRVVSGFVQGFDVACGVATTVAHDYHHLLVTGTCAGNMAQAANTLVDAGGGVAVVREGAVTALVELPICGLMSDEPAGVVAGKSARVMRALAECGCALNNGCMQLSPLALAVIPELRITDLGLIDVSRFTHIPVIQERLSPLWGMPRASTPPENALAAQQSCTKEGTQIRAKHQTHLRDPDCCLEQRTRQDLRQVLTRNDVVRYLERSLD